MQVVHRSFLRRSAELEARARSMRHSPIASEELLFQTVRGRRLGVAFRRQCRCSGGISRISMPRRFASSSRWTAAITRRGGAVTSGGIAQMRAAGYRVLRVETEAVMRELPN